MSGEVESRLVKSVDLLSVPDVRPGLLFQRGEKRKHEQLKRQEELNRQNKEKYKSRKQIEEENRQQGLQKEIPPDNKGYLLLQKMGYKPGSSIGKGLDSDSNAMKAPINVEIKTNRKGLGHKSVMIEKKAKIEETKIKNEIRVEDYRQRIVISTTLKETLRDLRKAQFACQSLDANHGKEEPIEKWYWPEIPKPADDLTEPSDTEKEDDSCIQPEIEDVLPEPHEQLELLSKYLRSNYLYCLWCGTSYEDDEDLLKSCPGNDKEEH